ncbi:unnamed protein product [Macrosiphum euphorbiae]|uniref:Ig-like domain-containing protein n=1 Tax=Macrosiphum euphorbiae TaxID=13131 RepID=A0AAV0Y7P6_9HEMI|nr:unnamed protein product [Macrosiphum euphorbiae]
MSTAMATLYLIVSNAFCLRLMKFKIAKHSIVGNSTRLECKYDLQGEQLYTVKWYRDTQEFYRFLPRESPEIQMFKVMGVYVDQKQSTAESIVLRALEVESSGKYRCEVSVEAPSFQTVTNYSVLTVVVPVGSHKLEVNLISTPTSSTQSLNINMIIFLCTIAGGYITGIERSR